MYACTYMFSMTSAGLMLYLTKKTFLHDIVPKRDANQSIIFNDRRHKTKISIKLPPYIPGYIKSSML